MEVCWSDCSPLDHLANVDMLRLDIAVDVPSSMKAREEVEKL